MTLPARVDPATRPLAGSRITLFSDDFEASGGWQTNAYGTDTASSGRWERGDPQGTNSSGPKQLGATTSGVSDLSTGRLAGSSASSHDVDGGVTSIASPSISLTGGSDYTLSFRYYLAHASNSSSADFFRVRVVGPSSTVTVFEERGGSNDDDAAWATASVNLDAFAGTTVRLLFQAADAGGASLVEAAVDDVSITALPAAVADLTVADIQITGDPACFAGNFRIVAVVQVRNDGVADAEAFFVDLNGERRRADRLPAGQSTRLYFDNWEGATERAEATADSTNVVGEANESNNVLVVTDLGSPSPPPPCLIGYFPSWGPYVRNFFVKNVETSGAASRLNVINYAFGNVVNNRCTTYDTQMDYYRQHPPEQSVDGVGDNLDHVPWGHWGQLKKLKRLHPQLKVMVSLGGWNLTNGFYSAARAENRREFVKSCIDLFIRGDLPDLPETPYMAANIFDGIDVDWEYPGVCGPPVDKNNLPCSPSGEDQQNFVELMAEFRRQLDDLAAEKGDGRRYLLTAAVGAGEETMAQILPAVGASVDWLAVMAYDFHGSWETHGPTNFHSALYPSPNDPAPNADKLNADWAVNHHLSKLPPEKIVLGVPFYGRGWAHVYRENHGLYQPAAGPAYGRFNEPVEDYSELKQMALPGREFEAFRDPDANACWIFDESVGIFWAYDDPVVLANKARYAVEKALGGIMFWDLAGDTTDSELVRAIYDNLYVR